jgi:hypothetical protein
MKKQVFKKCAIEFPKPKAIDWSKYIEPKKAITETKGNVSTTLLVSLDSK